MKKQFMILSAAVLVITISCSKKFDTTGNNNDGNGLIADSSIAPPDFNFETTKPVSLNIRLASATDEPIAGVPVNVYSNDPESTAPLFTGLSDASGYIRASIMVPAYMDSLVIDPAYIGLRRNALVYISGGSVDGVIGGSNGYSGNVTARDASSSRESDDEGDDDGGGSDDGNSSHTHYSSMGSYNSNGVPNYLEPTRDVISSELLNFINTSLPERVDVRRSHPQYLLNSNTADLNITALSDVWITFVGEGAGYRNTIGYYKYPTSTPPQKTSDIDTIHYIFPNASLPGSGGNLQPGSKVKLGRFAAGTSIGFVVLANAWNGSSINTDGVKFYSGFQLNPESTADLKKHTVLLWDDTHQLFLTGFEDLNRESGGCDNDFNDVVIYSTCNPVNAVSRNGVQPIDEPGDADGDGVTDVFDQFPNDPTRAYITYYPSENGRGTLAFEDLWPATGDYDLNDMVVHYRHKFISNGQNRIVEMYSDFNVQASGASFVSGFGLQFPFSPSNVAQVTGSRLVSNYITLSSNGTEAGQSKAVIIPFDSYKAIIQRPGGYYINTQTGAPYVNGDTVHMYIRFTSPMAASNFVNEPFNPFLISNGRRGYEVHLPGTQPTDLADRSLLGTKSDATSTNRNYYYKTKYSWPFALSFPENFDYPSEANKISISYLHFLQWAQSGGSLYADWYLNKSGYRDASKIYHR